MASPALAGAHRGAGRLRALTGAASPRIWRELPGYDRANVDEWLSRCAGRLDAGQRTSVALTEAYLAQALGAQPLGVDPTQIDRRRPARRHGSPAEVYERPFVTLWTALGEGTPFEDAVSRWRSPRGAPRRWTCSSRCAHLERGRRSRRRIYGYQRVADGGACEFCQEVDGAYVKDADAMPLHNNCGCGVDPLTGPSPAPPSCPPATTVASGPSTASSARCSPTPGRHFTTEPLSRLTGAERRPTKEAEWPAWTRCAGGSGCAQSSRSRCARSGRIGQRRPPDGPDNRRTRPDRRTRSRPGPQGRSRRPGPDKVKPDDDWQAKARKHERAAKRERKAREDAERSSRSARTPTSPSRRRRSTQAREEAKPRRLTEAEKERRSDRLEVAVTRLAAKGVKIGEGDDAKTVRSPTPTTPCVYVERAIRNGDIDEDDIFDERAR
jgi:hypothetical protein